jgi:hypothetical protein
MDGSEELPGHGQALHVSMDNVKFLLLWIWRQTPRYSVQVLGETKEEADVDIIITSAQ